MPLIVSFGRVEYFCFKHEYLYRLISGFDRALLQSVTFISRLNALDYTKLRS